LGTKQTEQTKKLISKALKGRLFSKESKTKMQEVAKLRQGIKTSFFGKNHTLETITRISDTKSLIVKVTDVKTGISKTFRGNAQAAKYLNIGESTLRRYKKLGKLLNGKYSISNMKI
jgi:group I intron endonuclease